jgi:phosphoglycolate phosphatase
VTHDATRIDAVVFDLDGTLVDSYGAIADALNATRREFDLEPVPEERVRFIVGHGLERLIEEQIGAAHVREGVARFRAHYDAVVDARTSALPGTRETLEELRAQGVRLGVASNKADAFVARVLETVGLAEPIAVARGLRAGEPPKPDPTILLGVLFELGSGPGGAVYVGDMPLDAETADRAGCRAVLVPTGSAEEEELRAVRRAEFLPDIRLLPRRLLER